LKAVLAIVAACSVTACASFSTMKTARAIDPGTSQFSMIGSAVGTTLPNANNNDGVTRAEVAPQFEVAWRYGIFDGFDLGAKLTSLGGELNSTISLVRSNGFDLALAPAVGLTGYTYNTCDGCGGNVGVWEVYGKLALLFGLRFGPSREHEFVFGPEVVPIGITASDSVSQNTASGSTVLVGGVVGVSFKVSPWLRIMPELTVLTPASTFSLPDSIDVPLYNRFSENNAVFYQAGLGFSWGDDGFGRPRYSPPPRRYYAPPPQPYPGYYAPPPTYAPPPPGYAPPPPPQAPPPNERGDT
jgi:hypothetical protein